MAIPKMKIYRLDQNYSPDSDSDIKTITSDEAYPFVEKGLDLGAYETLVGVTYRDLMAGKLYDGGTVYLDMYSEDEGNTIADYMKTAFISCEGWKKGAGAFQIYIAVNEGDYQDTPVPEDYYRVNYSTLDEMLDASGNVTENTSDAVAKQRIDTLQIEFGNKLYSSGLGDYISNSSDKITGVKLEYMRFTDDLNATVSLSGNTDPVYALEYGNIYDGTRSGRLGVVDSSGYTSAKDSDGFPIKAEGNLGYKIRTYPCRVLVASQSNKITLGTETWIRNVEISDSGSISLEGCESWILTKTDERRPRLFERRTAPGGANYFHELTSNEQYTLTNVPGENGIIDINIQLSSDYYNIEYGKYVYPEVVFIRYNEEIDIQADLFEPNYLQCTNSTADGSAETVSYWRKSEGTDTGMLTTNSSDFSSVKRRIFHMALPAGSGYNEANGDFLMEKSTTQCQINLASIYYSNAGTGDVFTDMSVYYQGKLIWQAKQNCSDSPFNLTVSGTSLIVQSTGNAELPSGILIAYSEPHALGMGSDGEQNYWCCGYRICCYEKSRTASEFVSSFRNWVADHLNNNPDIFQGFQTYEGSAQNATAISYIDSGYSILYREGAVQFSDPITQANASDVRNWPPAGASITATDSIDKIRLYLNQVYAKFAYYDGIMDVTNGLLREFSVDSGVYKYRLLEDPTYSELLGNQRWIIRNDSKMPTTFFYHNSYLPATNYVESGECELWEAMELEDDEILRINLSDYRVLAITPSGGRLVWSSGYDGETQKTTTQSEAEVAWYITPAGLRFGSETGEIVLPAPLTNTDFDPDKTVAENIQSRADAEAYRQYTYSPENSTIPYRIVFETGEDYLLVYAKKIEG